MVLYAVTGLEKDLVVLKLENISFWFCGPRTFKSYFLMVTLIIIWVVTIRDFPLNLTKKRKIVQSKESSLEVRNHLH